LFTGVGSENTKRGSAKLMKPFLYYSISSIPWTNLYISAETQPVIIAVVVAMAGIIFPAIIFVFYYVLSGIL
jgi:hypothetical protein